MTSFFIPNIIEGSGMIYFVVRLSLGFSTKSGDLMRYLIIIFTQNS